MKPEHYVENSQAVKDNYSEGSMKISVIERKEYAMRNISIRTLLLFTFLSLCLYPLSACESNTSTKEAAAVEAADKWLALVDNSQYTESWSEAADYFKNVIDKEQWKQTLTSVRDPLGKTISRKIKSTKYMTEVPGAPDGEYVVIQYETSFENKKNSIETVTPMLDKDGVWRVSGYYIK
ncbi:MAG TPA: DUF4019 domain-containing protein [Nitrospirae bacterium]|nr:DUF4019 domain-containing protein [Nitrospirota bacterium]